MISIADKIAMARMWGMHKFPYFSHAITALIPREVPGFPTVGVSKRGVMIYGPEFVDSQGPEAIGFIMVHECLHILKDHMDYFSDDVVENRLRNYAMDLEINWQLSEACGYSLPSGLYPQRFNYPNNLTWFEYLQLMKKDIEENNKNGKKLEKMLGEPGSAGEGFCGGAASNPSQYEIENGLTNENPSDYKDGFTTSRLDRIKANVAQRIREAAERGQLPGSMAGMEKWAAGVLQPPKINWRDKLARRVRRGIAAVSGRNESTYTKQSRRQGVYGYGSDKPVLVGHVNRIPKIWVALDTSGSMFYDELLTTSVSEIVGIMKSFPNCTFLSADVSVATKVNVSSVRDITANVVGGGGTAFDDVFRTALREKKQNRPSIIVYVTDGCGSVSETDYGIPTVWCLVGQSQRPAPWGDVIVIED